VDVYVESVSDVDVTAFSSRVCRLDVIQVGSALPCVTTASQLEAAAYTQSAPTRPFNDLAEMYLGQVCPANYPSAPASYNQFVARLIYELPPQANLTSTSYLLSGGLRVGNSTIWVSSRTYTTLTSDYSALTITKGNNSVASK
jgi:hypothetical protein